MRPMTSHKQSGKQFVKTKWKKGRQSLNATRWVRLLCIIKFCTFLRFLLFFYTLSLYLTFFHVFFNPHFVRTNPTIFRVWFFYFILPAAYNNKSIVHNVWKVTFLITRQRRTNEKENMFMYDNVRVRFFIRSVKVYFINSK